jgi:hypothetical protein
MNASNAIKERVDRFVDEILSLMRRVQEEHRAAALRTVTAMLAGRPERATSVHRRGATSGKSQPVPAKRPTRGTRSRVLRPSTTAAPARKKAPATSPVSASIPADRTAEATIEPVPSSGGRETVVLEAVRALVRGTAAEIAKHGGLPNGSVYVVLRSLVARGKVARAETPRGVEYSLVSSGKIRPFKRVKAATPTSPAEVERTADAVVAEQTIPLPHELVAAR